MSAQQDDRDFRQWASEWQADAPRAASTEEQIRRYVKRRSGLMWSFAVIDCVIAGTALPLLTYLGIMAKTGVERVSMFGLAAITIATFGFAWWNWRGVLRSSAVTTAEYVEISTERLRRLRLAWRVAWIVLVAEGIVFVIWITDLLYGGARELEAGAERFAWAWFTGFMLAAAVSLIWFGRWISRDAGRFDALRRELTRE